LIAVPQHTIKAMAMVTAIGNGNGPFLPENIHFQC
jgi:hypothetical protein